MIGTVNSPVFAISETPVCAAENDNCTPTVTGSAVGSSAPLKGHTPVVAPGAPTAGTDPENSDALRIRFGAPTPPPLMLNVSTALPEIVAKSARANCTSADNANLMIPDAGGGIVAVSSVMFCGVFAA